MGCVMQAGEQSNNIGRNAVMASKLPESVPATSIDRQCGSSQQALHFAAQGVIAGAYDVKCDVTDPASVDALAASVFERYGACHLLFNNAGVGTAGPAQGREHLGRDAVADHDEAHEGVGLAVVDGPVPGARLGIRDRVLEVADHQPEVPILTGASAQMEHGLEVVVRQDVTELDRDHQAVTGAWRTSSSASVLA